ncbi:MAG: DUF3800 domain-containing protein [Candidatus Margulisiibacteriota bacterium]|jgi:hypothetical protein
MPNKINDTNRARKSYIFLDESGKPEVFSKRGENLVRSGKASKYLIIAAVRTTDHLQLQQAGTNEKLNILNNNSISTKFSPAYSLDSFHAQVDYPEVKQHFYNWIASNPLGLKLTVIVAEKQKAYLGFQQDPGRLYANVAGQLLKNFLHTADGVEVIFSRKDGTLKARENLQLVVDTHRLEYANSHNITLPARISYHHKPHYTHTGLQVADYVAHAVFQVFENGNRQWWDIIKDSVSTVQDIFNKQFYTKRNPL